MSTLYFFSQPDKTATFSFSVYVEGTASKDTNYVAKLSTSFSAGGTIEFGSDPELTQTLPPVQSLEAITLAESEKVSGSLSQHPRIE